MPHHFAPGRLPLPPAGPPVPVWLASASSQMMQLSESLRRSRGRRAGALHLRQIETTSFHLGGECLPTRSVHAASCATTTPFVSLARVVMTGRQEWLFWRTNGETIAGWVEECVGRFAGWRALLEFGEESAVECLQTRQR